MTPTIQMEIASVINRLLLTLRHARAMWRVLSNPKNVRKGDWHMMQAMTLYRLAEIEMKELKHALWEFSHGECTIGHVESEAADVSAFVAMIADRCRRNG